VALAHAASAAPAASSRRRPYVRVEAAVPPPNGRSRAVVAMWTFPTLDRLGVSPRTLARLCGDPR
jgi:hypothetical protein